MMGYEFNKVYSTTIECERRLIFFIHKPLYWLLQLKSAYVTPVSVDEHVESKESLRIETSI